MTRGVDAVAAIHSYAAYAAFGERLRGLGFAEDTSEGHRCANPKRNDQGRGTRYFGCGMIDRIAYSSPRIVK
jgi:hypothetical protein